MIILGSGQPLRNASKCTSFRILILFFVSVPYYIFLNNPLFLLYLKLNNRITKRIFSSIYRTRVRSCAYKLIRLHRLPAWRFRVRPARRPCRDLRSAPCERDAKAANDDRQPTSSSRTTKWDKPESIVQICFIERKIWRLRQKMWLQTGSCDSKQTWSQPNTDIGILSFNIGDTILPHLLSYIPSKSTISFCPCIVLSTLWFKRIPNVKKKR